MTTDQSKLEKLLGKTIDPVFKELAKKMGEEDSRVLPYVFEKAMTLEQAKILNNIKLPVEEIAEKLGLDQTVVNAHCQELFEKGL